MSVLHISRALGRARPLTAILSETEPEDDSDNEDEGILNAFTTTVNPTNGIIKDVVEEEEFGGIQV